MFIFKLRETVREARKEKNLLEKEKKRLCPHSLAVRKKRGVKFYSERYAENDLIREKTLSREEYCTLFMEDYNYRRCEEELKIIDSFLKKYDKMYDKLNAVLEKRFDDLSECNMTALPENVGEYKSENLRYNTLRGETVRSKSEEDIANILYHHGVRYEYESRETGLKTLPDFYIKDNITGTPVIWEHFGLMNEPEYVEKMLKKIKYYEENGYVAGKNLIVTYELYSENGDVIIPFDSRDAENEVKKWFLP